MSRLAEFRAAEKALQEQIAQLEALKQDAGLKREIEFEQKLLGLMKTYERACAISSPFLTPRAAANRPRRHPGQRQNSSVAPVWSRFTRIRTPAN